MVTDEIVIQLREHRSQKLASLRGTIPPLFVVLAVACLHSRSYPWQETLWRHGPSATAIGLNFAFWAAEITMDTALDECGPLKLYIASAFAGILQLKLIAVLTTSPRGHMVFWLKATETLLATALAKLIDHPLWIGIAAVVSCFVAVMAVTGRLAPLPPNVPVAGAVSYFAATVLASTFYQLIQNFAWAGTAIGNVKLIRALLCCLSTCVWGTPPSWILYDAINFANFFGLKVATDTLALQAVSECR